MLCMLDTLELLFYVKRRPWCWLSVCFARHINKISIILLKKRHTYGWSYSAISISWHSGAETKDIMQNLRSYTY